jgi:uncharacterized protein (TIGR02145 family)
MKKTSLFILGLILSVFTFAQAPNKMSFQTVVRNSQGKLVVNQSIGVRTSILQGSSSGNIVYVETHTKSSNINGLVTLEIGTGTVTSGVFTLINWSQGPYFLKTELDVNGGSNYTISGVTEFVSVPYALSSKNSDSSVFAKNAVYSDTAKNISILKKGVSIGDMNYWDGEKWVALNGGVQNQTLTFCEGKPTWTVGGICPGRISAFDCSSITNIGELVHGRTVGTDVVITTLKYSGGNKGPYSALKIYSSGVSGLTATLSAGTLQQGNGELVFKIEGTPTSVGLAVFNVEFDGKLCSFSREVLPSKITALNCLSPVHEGLLLNNQTVSNGVTSSISYNGGNGGAIDQMQIPSSGVTGLFATIKSGYLSLESGSILVTYSGNASSTGIASFPINIGGVSCVLERTVDLRGTVSSLSCTPTNLGTLIGNRPASGVSSKFGYSGGNGGKFENQIINSTGVLGLTANLNAGTLSSSTGTISYTISGTPSSVGTAFFTISIGGKVCTLSRTVSLSAYAPNVSDIEGNSYKTVYIGNQQWMGENLKTAKYNDGTAIPNITDNTQWSNNTTGAWSYYNNDAANNVKYGKLYNWFAVSSTTNGNKNMCPTGWHVPTDAEWTVLIDYLGGTNVAGGKMKEVGTSSWNSPNTEAANTSLFTGLPGGYRSNNGSYYFIGYYGYWWSSTEYGTSNAWSRTLGGSNGVAYRNYDGKELGFSVRCLRD